MLIIAEQQMSMQDPKKNGELNEIKLLFSHTLSIIRLPSDAGFNSIEKVGVHIKSHSTTSSREILLVIERLYCIVCYSLRWLMTLIFFFKYTRRYMASYMTCARHNVVIKQHCRGGFIDISYRLLREIFKSIRFALTHWEQKRLSTREATRKFLWYFSFNTCVVLQAAAYFLRYMISISSGFYVSSIINIK